MCVEKGLKRKDSCKKERETKKIIKINNSLLRLLQTAEFYLYSLVLSVVTENQSFMQLLQR